MSSLKVEALTVSDLPESIVSYREESGVLSAMIGPRRPCPRQVLVDSRIIFDVDEAGSPYGVEVVWPRSRWRLAAIALPARAAPGRVIFTTALAGVDEEVYDDQSEVFSDARGTTIYVRLVECAGSHVAVQMARDVIGDMCDKTLCGLWLSLPNKRARAEQRA